MPSTYSPNLRIELIGSGEQQNVWGNTTNNNLGTLLENSISGLVTLSAMTDTNYTLVALDGANDQARSMTLWIPSTVTLTAPRNLIAPAVPKMYIIVNDSTGGFAVGIYNGTGLGVYVPNGTTRIVFSDGVDFFYAGSTALEVKTRAGSFVEVDLN